MGNKENIIKGVEIKIKIISKNIELYDLNQQFKKHLKKYNISKRIIDKEFIEYFKRRK